MMLRGYLKSSIHRVCSTGGGTAGSSISLRDPFAVPRRAIWRASSKRPHAHQPMRRLGDEGADVQGQKRRQQSDGEQAAPADIGRRIGPQQRAEQKARRQHRGGQPGDPAALLRPVNSCIRVMSTEYRPVTPKPTKSRQIEQIDPSAVRASAPSRRWRPRRSTRCRSARCGGRPCRPASHRTASRTAR